MAIYTGVADVNGDFTVPFSSNYTSGQKVTVTAEKDSATKSIELFAPSDVVGGTGKIDFTGDYSNFPNNLGQMVVSGEMSNIGARAFQATGADSGLFLNKLTGLILNDGVQVVDDYAFADWRTASSLSIANTVTSIGVQAFFNWKPSSLVIPDSVLTLKTMSFMNWSNATTLKLSNQLTQIPANCFSNWVKCLSINIPDSVSSILDNAFNGWRACTDVEIGTGIMTIGSSSFGGLFACNEIIVKATIPPTIESDSFSSLKSTCIFKVPAESVAAYQAAPNWSAFASRIQAI